MSYHSGDAPVTSVEGDDLYPADEEQQKKITEWVRTRFLEADRAKQGYQELWDGFYKMYRSYVAKKKRGDWRSRVWIPLSFFTIETVAPRIVAQLPAFKVNPIEEADVVPAEKMDEALRWAQEQSGLYLELVKAAKSALIYGTGILKTMYKEETKYNISREPMMEERLSDVPTGMKDMDGNPMTETVSLGAQPVLDEQGRPVVTVVRRPYVSYSGPAAEAVDIDDFFIDPQADSIENARYVIHRVYRDKAHMEQMFEQGVYKRPSDLVWDSYLNEHSTLRRQASVGLGPGPTVPYESGQIAILELWTDDLLIACTGDGKSVNVLLRVERNPYGHGEKPFCRIVDYLVPHEFWGIGELEPLVGLQEAINGLWNSRLDNVKLGLNKMWAAVQEYIKSPDDLQSRPGGIVWIKEGMPPDDAIHELGTSGEVTASSYKETAEVERFADKVSGISAAITGAEGLEYQRTATGLVTVAEQANTRFAHKVKIAEITGFKRLGRQFGENLKQFMPQEMVLRVLGPEGQWVWTSLRAEDITVPFDYDIEPESSTQTESIQKEQALSLFQLLGFDPFVDPLWTRLNLLKKFGYKDAAQHLVSPEQIAAQQQQALPAGEEGAQGG